MKILVKKYNSENILTFLLRNYNSVDALPSFIELNSLSNLDDFDNIDEFFIEASLQFEDFSVEKKTIEKDFQYIFAYKDETQTLADFVISTCGSIDYLGEFLLLNNFKSDYDYYIKPKTYRYLIPFTDFRLTHYTFKISSSPFKIKKRAHSSGFNMGFN